LAKFIFRLESLFQVKIKLEEQCKLEYGLALAALEAEKQKKAAMEAQRQETLHSFKSKLAVAVDSEAFRQHNLFLDALKHRIHAQEKVIAKAEAFAEEKRLALVEAMKERKTLEKLKETEYEEYLLEENKAEQKRVDAIVSYQFNRRSR